ncbi:MAG TPA: THxN family PEP-CTERM protein [Gammaproteobacteria bacterium]
MTRVRRFAGAFTRASTLALALVTLVPAGSVSAATIQYLSVTGIWHDPVDNVPGVQPGDPVITNGNPTSIIRWGTTSGTPQSGYDYTATIPPPFTLPGPIPFFSLGTFTHQNFVVSDPSLTSVQLDVVLVLDVDGVPTGPLTFTFTFNHEETPNNQNPCPYPTPPGEGCTDRVTIVASPQPTTFNVGGVDYTLAMNFLLNGQPVSEYITREGGTVNSSGLVGEFTLPPGLTVSKSGPTTMNLAEWGDFAIDVPNGSASDAHNVTLVDRLPDGPTGGMCDTTPQVLSARVFAADGVTPVPGKGPLVQGTDYSLAYDGVACELTLSTISAASVIGVDERLIVAYRARLDADTQDGITLTNVAGATEWFDDADTNPGRVTYTRTLTDGTVGVGDHEDAHTVTVDLHMLRFDKTVANVSRGTNPATFATPGEMLRYTFRVENLGTVAINAFSIVDELDALNATPGFAPGTLNVVTVPAGADVTNTSATGGAAGTGLVDIRNLSLGVGAVVLVEFEVALAPVLTDGSYVENQAALLVAGYTLAQSDDPNVNGIADPSIAGDEDPTRVQIESAPRFDVDKISTDLTADPNVLLSSETLRYTITVRNVGTDDALDVTLRDDVPANTTYVAGSTTLNGMAIADGPSGLAPLVNGVLIYAAAEPTPGTLRAGAMATIEFDVVVYPNLPDGTVISNQGFVSAAADAIFDQPSDDPATPVPDDPTRDIVGNAPLLFVAKSAALLTDLGTPGIVDPGDVLRYTITMYNNGTITATNVVLTDAVPANTTYYADSTTLNGLPVGQPDGGTSPLAAGIPVSSADLTPPLPGLSEGTLTAGQSAVLQFDLQVNAGVPPGTLITNQALLTSDEIPSLLSDGDGNPATGPEPTVVVVGDAQQLRITKAVAVVGGGPVISGATLEYTVGVTNIGAVPAYNVLLRDDLDVPNPGYLTFVPGSWAMNGSVDGITVAGQLLTADYFATYGALAPGGTITLRFRALIAPGLVAGQRITNTATVYWNDPQQTASASVSVDIGGTPGIGILNGRVWHDADFDDVADGAERYLAGWSVELYRNSVLTQTVLTDANGLYTIAGVMPNYLTTDTLELRFRRPGAGPNTALLGTAHSDFTNDLQRIYDIVVMSGNNLQNLDLPIEPNGVIYDSIGRAPITGARVTLVDAAGGAPLPSSCFYDVGQQDQVTLADGYYKFDINFADAACPSGGSYVISVAPPSSAYVPGVSAMIPPLTDATTAAFAVPTCPGSINDAVPVTSSHCEVQPSEFAPSPAIPPRTAGTNYHLKLLLDDSFLPGTSQLFNNHIPLDLDLDDSVTITKTTPIVNVSRGELVPYTITVTNGIGVNLDIVAVVDRFPAGFRYVEESARLDGVAAEPVVNGRELTWSGLTITPDGQHTLQLLLAVGSGVGEGEFVNRAQAMNMLTGGPLSLEATATVRIVPDPDFDCTDVMGKVFDDTNRNGLQDPGEAGISGVRLATARGLVAMTDQYGRFHITCAITPHEGRGSNFVLKLDDRTLPSGYRGSTEFLQIKRATRGKALEFNFGASIHRVVGLDIADPVFEPGVIEMREIWRPRIELLVQELRTAPAVLRLSYLADLEDPRLVEQRLDSVRAQVMNAWSAQEDCCLYQLEVETEVFWRRGAPPEDAEQRRDGRGDR